MKICRHVSAFLPLLLAMGVYRTAPAAFITSPQAAQLDIRPVGERSMRITLKPLEFEDAFPFTPALVEHDYGEPAVSLRELGEAITARVGTFNVEIRPNPIRIVVTRGQGEPVQNLVFENDGGLSFQLDEHPVLGLGEGGPQPGRNWRSLPVEFDRRGRYHEMRPRWQSNAYGSRNPVALLVGTAGWGLFVATPWVHVDLSDGDRGKFVPWQPPAASSPPSNQPGARRRAEADYTRHVQGRPPVDSVVAGLFDVFVFDASDPLAFMKDVSTLTGPAVLPPQWSLGYMQSHRELRDSNMNSEALLLHVVDTFREKKIPLDSVVYLGTGFTPTGWNTRQPSFEFNPEVFQRDAKNVIADLHARHVKVALHMVPPSRDEGLPSLHGNIPPQPGETLDDSHIQKYWRRHLELFDTPIDGWWPDEGDWLNLWERMTRHKMYYQGPIAARPGVRPWSLHRNGHLGIARWGGWVWSGDTDSSWKTLEAQIAVGLNHSLSLSPYWGSDTGGFYANIDPPELSGELYARWFQFSAFCPSFRSHGRIWRLRVPWGWGLSDMGFTEGQRNPPDESELNNPRIEEVCRRYANLRYQLMPYTYTLAWQARDTGLPFMRALWLHYPDDEHARGLGNQYLWGRDLLVAPVFERGAASREVYLPHGEWYDWWTHEKVTGGRTITREVDLDIMPLYARAGAIIPFDPVRQYTGEQVDEPTTLKIFRGADGEFTIYEDDGTSLEYLQGRATWTRLTWDNSEHRLVIEPGPPPGSTNLEVDRKFLVELLPEGRTLSVPSNGRRVEARF